MLFVVVLLLLVPCSWFVVRCFFVVDVCCLLFGRCPSLLMFVIRCCLLLVAIVCYVLRLWFVARCVLCVAFMRLSFVVCNSLFGVCCLLIVVGCCVLLDV